MQPHMQPPMHPSMQPPMQPSMQPPMQSTAQPNVQPPMQPPIQPSITASNVPSVQIASQGSTTLNPSYPSTSEMDQVMTASHDVHSDEEQIEEGEISEDEDDRSVTERIVSDTTYEERIAMVGDILGESLPATVQKSKNFTKALGDGKEVNLVRLPASEGFKMKFTEFTDELAAKPGSQRAKDEKQRTPYRIGKLPTFKMAKFNKFYEIGECPWPTAAPPYQSSLLKSDLYEYSPPPGHSGTFEMSTDRILAWEGTGSASACCLTWIIS